VYHLRAAIHPEGVCGLNCHQDKGDRMVIPGWGGLIPAWGGFSAVIPVRDIFLNGCQHIYSSTYTYTRVRILHIHYFLMKFTEPYSDVTLSSEKTNPTPCCDTNRRGCTITDIVTYINLWIADLATKNALKQWSIDACKKIVISPL
jgi:hypothetical protein